MHGESHVTSALAGAALLAFGLGDAAVAAEGYRISGPIVHENLAIYPVHGPSAGGPAPLTLQEALAERSVQVRETGNVNQLEVENLGDAEVFIQSGDIVKGGQQDRTLTVSLVLPPRSGRIPIAAFCVEQGRWSARGQEDAKRFTTAAASVPSREAKIAMRAPPAPAPAGAYVAAADTGVRQRDMWRNVSKIQDRLSRNLGADVASPRSQSSLQLSLENEKVRDAQLAYVKGLQAAGEPDDVVGYAFAINGKLNSVEVYPSNALFRKMWPKLLTANAIEAIGEKSSTAAAPPSTDEVMAFIEAAEQGKASEKPLNAGVSLETRDADNALYFETRRADGAWVHRNYLAK